MLAVYAGVYQIPGGGAIVVRADGSELKVRIGLQTEVTALPASETTFFVRPGLLIEFPKGQAHPDFVTVHRDGYDSSAKRLDEAAAKPFLEAAAAFDKRLQEQKPVPGSEAAARKLIADLQAGKPDESIISEGGPLRPQLADVQSQVAQMGRVRSIHFERVGPAGSDIYSIKTDRGSWEFRIWMAEDGKIDFVDIQPAQ
jgi:hypothetical protein